MPAPMNGTITRINRQRQLGEIRGDDGSVRSFERENMVRWLQFNELAPGARVTYEVEQAGQVINVERIDQN
jgi:cold shock CspA family protein